MKIIILVLIFSLLYKLKCEKSENPPELQDDGMDADGQEDLADKMDADVQEDSADKMDFNVQQDSTEQLISPLQADPADQNIEEDQTCEDCGDEKQFNLKGEDEDQVDQVKAVMHLFPSGDVADLFGNNQHYKIPDNYQDFGRRFVLQYPYTEKKSADEKAEDDMHNTVQQFLKNKEDSEDPLPVKAPPEFVLDLAKKSLFLEASKPKNPTDDIIHKNILRSGNYWNDVRKEDIDPKKILRSSQSKNNLEPVKVEIKPGSKLFNLISKLKEKSPRLLYVINKNVD